MTMQMVRDDGAVSKVLSGPEGDFLREAVARVVHELMEAEVSAQAGAERYERTGERSGYRNGHRSRRWLTRLGEIGLQIPRLREGGYVPSFLDARKRGERALLSVIQEAYVLGLSTRKVDELVEVMGGTGVPKSTVSRICQELDVEAEAFRERELDEEIPYLWLDALYEKVREGGRVISMAVVLAIGVTASGARTVVGVSVGNSESEAFWTSFLRSLVKRGLSGVQLVISDAHEGLKGAIAKTLAEATWQRCRVHTMRNVLAHVPKQQQAMVMAAVKTIFVQPSQAEAHKQLGQIVQTLTKSCPKAAEVLERAAVDVLAYMSFPSEHWRQLHSTNPIERQNKEIRRRTRVVGIFPNRASALRLVSMLMSEQHDEWQAAERAYMSQTSMAKVTTSVLAPPGMMKGVATG